jgi:hypothetical protein
LSAASADPKRRGRLVGLCSLLTSFTAMFKIARGGPHNYAAVDSE